MLLSPAHTMFLGDLARVGMFTLSRDTRWMYALMVLVFHLQRKMQYDYFTVHPSH